MALMRVPALARAVGMDDGPASRDGRFEFFRLAAQRDVAGPVDADIQGILGRDLNLAAAGDVDIGGPGRQTAQSHIARASHLDLPHVSATRRLDVAGPLARDGDT